MGLSVGAILVALTVALTGACGGGGTEKETTTVQVNEEGVTEKIVEKKKVDVPEEGKTEVKVKEEKEEKEKVEDKEKAKEK